MGAEGAFLGGEILIERGTVGDYAELERFHYVGGRPATWAGVWRVVFEVRSTGSESRLQPETLSRQPEGRTPNISLKAGLQTWTPLLAAVGVLSWPTLACGVRERHFGIGGWSRAAKIEFVNQNLRTISRVIVHPRFRGIGIASMLVRRMCAECPTRYVEAMSVMGRVHPMFERGGMKRVRGGGRRDANGKEAAYYVWERAGRDKAEEGELKIAN